MDVRPAVLEGRHVRLEPLRREHVGALCEAGAFEELWTVTMSRADTAEGMRVYVEEALAEQERGDSLPFVIVKVPENAIVGSTRFGNIYRPFRRVEIGWTWITPAWQGTMVNTEIKYLMMRHAFETWDAIRVEFKTDSINHRSRRALLGIGATQEGVLRNHMIAPSGRIRHSVYFSVTGEEWPSVKWHLETKLAGERKTYVQGVVAVTRTYLEMKTRPKERAADGIEGFVVHRAVKPTVDFYRYLYNTVGGPWRWMDRRRMSDHELRQIIQHPEVEVFVAYIHGTPAGYFELDLRGRPDVEIAYFGIMPEFVGGGLGRSLLNSAVRTAWARHPRRVWLHTCTLDHPAALPLYQKAGFVPYQTEEYLADLREPS
jgi:RimJ/RimL family protein N-acetyltransferase